MRVVVVSRDQTDYARGVESFMTDFTRQTGRKLELLDPDSADGIHFCATYGIVEYPTVIALSDDGQMQNIWRGVQMPTVSEVSYYA